MRGLGLHLDTTAHFLVMIEWIGLIKVATTSKRIVTAHYALTAICVKRVIIDQLCCPSKVVGPVCMCSGNPFFNRMNFYRSYFVC